MSRIFYILILIVLTSVVLQSQDFSYDKQIGAEAAVQVEQMIGIYPDSVLNAYISEVGNRLAVGLGKIPFEFRFSVVDMPEPNAFALPGGYIYVSRGILSLMNEEDELAGVIGHEMIHVTKRHSVKQMKKGIIPGILKIPGALIGLVNKDLGRIVNTPVNFGTAMFMSSYSRKQEKESDELGIKLAAKAGYDPVKLAGVLDHLAAEMEIQSGEEEKKSYFSSHPYTPKRVEDINEKAPLINWESKPAFYDRNGFYKKLDGMIVGPNPAQGVFEENVFRHPDLNIALNFPEKWETINVPVAVLASQADGNAQIFLGAESADLKPDSLGALFAEMLEEKYKIKPEQNKKIEINGFKGYIVSFKDLSGDKAVDIQLYWVTTEKVLLTIAALGYSPYYDELSKSVKSLRPLTKEEKSNIKVVRVRLATAHKNETLESFSERSSNFWDVKTTALMNNLEPDGSLNDGQVLKIAVEESYFKSVRP